MTDVSTLDDLAQAFVDALVPAVEELAATLPGVNVRQLRSGIVLDAYNLARGFIDANEPHTEEELWALTATFGPRMLTQLGRARPSEVRKASLLTGGRLVLGDPSTLLEALVRADDTSFIDATPA
jgi:hypothetical protein